MATVLPDGIAYCAIHNVEYRPPLVCCTVTVEPWDPKRDWPALVEQMAKPPVYRPPAFPPDVLAELQRRGYYRVPETPPMSKSERRLARRNQRSRR